MISPELKRAFERVLSEILGSNSTIKNLTAISGGCINNGLKAETSLGNFFIKYNQHKDLARFETEAAGLKLLKDTAVLSIPDVYAYGLAENVIYLILEFIEPARPRQNYWEDFGRSLALLHKKSNAFYGLDFDNYIGSLPQKNNPDSDWISFFVKQRLEPQIKLAFDSGKVNEQVVVSFNNLYKKLPHLLVTEKPSLIHGDLWSGNVMVNHQGWVALIDPAVYYGNREAELAFTQLFGGFTSGFYESYKESFPLEPGYENRFDIYNLYPLLVHVNLFGGGYLNSVVSILRRYA